MKKIIILGIFVLLVLVVWLILPRPQHEGKVCFGENCFSVEVAKTQQEKSRGLMFRESLPQNRGMLFIFEQEGIYPFWMMNTLIPLDMIWINKNNEIVFIKENAQPCTDICEPTIPDKEATYVLEINGGVSREINLKIGDKIVIHT